MASRATLRFIFQGHTGKTDERYASIQKRLILIVGILSLCSCIISPFLFQLDLPQLYVFLFECAMYYAGIFHISRFRLFNSQVLLLAVAFTYLVRPFLYIHGVWSQRSWVAPPVSPVTKEMTEPQTNHSTAAVIDARPWFFTEGPYVYGSVLASYVICLFWAARTVDFDKRILLVLCCSGVFVPMWVLLWAPVLVAFAFAVAFEGGFAPFRLTQMGILYASRIVV